MKKFLIVRADRPYNRQFDTAAEVAVFMWGKDPRNYNIFVRAEGLPRDCDRMATALTSMQLECTNIL